MDCATTANSVVAFFLFFHLSSLYSRLGVSSSVFVETIILRRSDNMISKIRFCKIVRASIFALVSSLLLSNSAVAKPQMPATMLEACQAQSIVEAQYLSYRPQELLGKIEYFTPPMAQFKVLRTVRGKDTPEYILVRYEFDDGSACLVPQNWKFSAAKMPKENSRWILFLNPIEGTPSWYQTYRGQFGRMVPGESTNKLLTECSAK